VAENVYEVIKGMNGPLIEKLDTNHELCSFIMLIYSHMIYVAAENPGDPKDLICNVTVELERLFKIQLSYSKSNDRPSRQVSISGDDKKFSRRNPTLVTLLQVNQNVRELPIRMVETLERWIDEKPYRKECGFANLKFENQMFWKNLVFTAEIVLKAEFDYETIRQMGWDKEPEQPTEEERRIILP
jgi:hypothetical protein